MVLMASFVGLSLALAGCIFSPKSGTGPPPETIVYQPPEYPDRVLESLRASYAARDSIPYRRCLDFDYAGTSSDLTDGSRVTLFNAEEVHHVQTFAKAPTITSVAFTLGSNSTWTRQPSDDPGHPEWAVIQISGSQLTLQIEDTKNGTLLVRDAANTYNFRFRPYTDKVHGPWTIWNSSRSDTLWTLVQWEEIHPS
jgi:hypothetical protein